MRAEYNMGGGGDTGKGLHKSFDLRFPFGDESGELHSESIWHAMGLTMSIVRVAEAPRKSSFSCSWIKIGHGPLLAVTETVIWIWCEPRKHWLVLLTLMVCWNWARMRIQMSITVRHLEALICGIISLTLKLDAPDSSIGLMILNIWKLVGDF